MNRRPQSFTLAAAVLLAACVPSFGQKDAPAGKVAPASGPAATKAKNKIDLATTDLAAIKRRPLPPFRPQIPKRIQLANGMIVFLQEDHELPLISASAVIRGGSEAEPAEKTGLISVFGSSWRTGGTKTRTGDQLDDVLEARAARIETGGGLTTVNLSLSCLKGDFDFAFEVFNDVLKNPEFRQDKIDLAKDGIRTGIARRNDTLGSIAERESTRIGYGSQSPYARVVEYATLASITRQDLLDWHASHVHPNNILFGITGDFDSTEMEARLRKAFESWPRGADYKAPQIAVPPPKPGVYFVDKSDVNQSEIRMIAPGIRRDNPDYYAVEVMNQIFGTGFGSRLFSSLRTREGLAYGVGGEVGSLLGHPGLTRASIGTKSSTTARAIEGLYREIEGMHTHPVTAEELQTSKDSILNSFVFEYASKAGVMQARISYELQGYPADFLERFQKGVEAVTAADVDRVARKYLDRSKFAVLVVGKAADFDKPLSTFGPVTNVDITIPTGDANAKAAPSVSNPEGKALLARVIEGMGGAERINAIKTFRRKVSIDAQGGAIESDEIDMTPSSVHTHLKTGMGEFTLVVTPQESFVVLGGAARPLPASNRDDVMNQLRRDAWNVAQHADDAQYVFSAGGSEKIGEIQAAILDVHASGVQVRWYVDPKSGHILRAQFQANSPSGPATQVIDYSDWKAVDGVNLPFKAQVLTNGEVSATVTITGYEINPVVDPKVFVKP